MFRRFFPPLLAAVACASQTPPPEPPATVVATAVPEAPARPPTALAAGSPRPNAFPPSPLTELASSTRELVIAAIEGRPLPSHPPTEPIRDPEKLVRLKSPLPPTAELDFIAFGVEIEIVLTDPAPPGAGDSPAENSIEALAFLSRTGLKVGGLRPSSEERTRPLPGWLTGAATFGRDVHRALRSGRVSPMLLGEAERPVIGNDDLFREVMEESPGPEKLRELEALAKRAAEPRGYELDDGGLLARDRSGNLYAFEIQFDEHDGQIVLDSSPLVRAERIENEKRRDAPALAPE